MLQRPLLVLVVSMAMACGLNAAAPITGSVAPDFALPAWHGSNVRLSEYRGQVVTLAFWSSRCGTCPAQLAALSDLQSIYGTAGLVTLAVSVDDDMTRAAEFARTHAVAMPMLLDARREVGRAYGVDRLPTIALIDRSGRVRQLYRDFRRTDNSYVSQLKALLDDSPLAPLRQ